jgi:uncharacterized protein YaaN involved in tellurite resistance
LKPLRNREPKLTAILNKAHGLMELGSNELGQLGLTEGDLPEINELMTKIDLTDSTSVSQFGQEIGANTAAFADELLEQVRNKDLADAGQKLSEVVLVAKKLNLSTFSKTKSTFPVIGALIDKFRLKSAGVLGQFESSKQQIDSLVESIGQTQTGLANRNVSLESMFASAKVEYRLLGLHIAAGKSVLTNFDKTSKPTGSALDAQAAFDIDAAKSALSIRISNLEALQQSTLQTLPQIRLIQANNRVLVDKFHTIREVTVPAWKGQYMVALGLNEQRNAVELAKTIDDTTNELLLSNAQLLQQNAVATAKSNQRLVIDPQTLQKVQTILIKTVEDVIEIQRDGVRQRELAHQQIQAMRADLTRKLTSKQAA